MKRPGTSKPIVLLLFCLLMGPLLAHEFWLEPEIFQYSRGDQINLRFRVGENFSGDNWKGNQDKVQTLRLFYNDVTDDLKNDLTDAAGDSLQFSVFEAGTIMVAFNSTNSFIELEAEKFNAYLEEDGLTEAADFRKQNEEADSAGREYYQRSVKTLIQVGLVKSNVFAQATGLPIDIIPQVNPYVIDSAKTMRFKILFEGSPLVNKKVRSWHRLAGSVTDSILQTNELGEVELPVTAAGEWMLSCVHMIRLTNDPAADWQSYWGSCTWGYTGHIERRDRSR
jgi:uncharacterized GH25 family protein